MPKYTDLTDRKFGRLLVLSVHPEQDKFGKTQWNCRCDCGKMVVAITATLNSGVVQSCGCFRRDMVSTLSRRRNWTNAINLLGIRFGRLLVKSRAENGSEGNAKWLCVCDCGGTITTEGRFLRSGASQSCGCINKEQALRHLKARKPTSDSGFRSLICQYKSAAKDANRSFLLDDVSFKLLTSSDCYYCGLPPTRDKTSSHGHSPYKCNGIDRIDNEYGYELWNCVPSCTPCNYAKRAMSSEQFESWRYRFTNYYMESFGL
jgi:hypothetical protein